TCPLCQRRSASDGHNNSCASIADNPATQSPGVLNAPPHHSNRAAVNLIDRRFVEELHLFIFIIISCTPPLRVMAVDNQPIGEGYLTHQTQPLELQVGLFHLERITFYHISSPNKPIILGLPWLRKHDPHI
ncbi:hypothetical protein QTP86_027866, partial [Hemibagrus guttatus]